MFAVRKLYIPILKVTTVALSFLSVPPCLHAQLAIEFQNISQDEGLSNNYIRCLLQDHLGFVWIGTENGLNRYDGRRFLEFRFDPDDNETLSSNWISALFEGHEENLWVGTTKGLNRLDRATGKFERLLLHTEEGIQADYPVQAIFEDRSHRLWVATPHSGILKITAGHTPGAYRLEKVAVSPAASGFNGSIRLNDLLQDEHGGIWIRSLEGLGRLDAATQKIEFFPFPDIKNQGPEELDGAKMTLDGRGNIIVAARPRGLFFINPSEAKLQLLPLSRYQPGFENVPLLSEMVFHNLLTEGRDLLWFSTETAIGRIDLNTGAHHFVNQEHQLFPFPVSTLMLGREGGLWAGALGSGLYFGARAPSPFRFYEHEANNPNSISGGAVRTIVEDNSGNVWVGLLGGGLDQFRFDEDGRLVKARNLRHKPEDSGHLLDNNIIEILKDRNGHLWIATNGGGLNKLDPETGLMEAYVHEPTGSSSLSQGRIWGLCEDRRGFIWAGAFDRGLNRIDPRTGKVKRFFHDPADANSLSNDKIKSLYTDKQGIIWIGTNHGLNRLDPETETFTHYFHSPEDPHSITGGNIWCIYEDREGYLWAGTSIGLSRLDRKAGKFERFYEKDGLPSNTIFGLLEDNEGALWVSTDNGLARLLRTSPKASFRAFKKKDGLGSGAFLPKAYFNSRRTGQLLFGSTDGLATISPELLQGDTSRPRLVLHSISKFNLRAKDGKPLEDPFISSKDGTLELTHLDQSVTFLISDLGWNTNQSYHYEYQLDGFHHRWMSLGDDMKITFTNLPPGNYTLKARTLNIDNIPSEATPLLAITVYPPWWKAWWAYSLYAILAGLLVYAVYRFQLARKLELKETENLRALDEFKSQLYTNITHEFRTPLSVISGMIEQVEGHDKIKNLIKRNAAGLLDLVNQILDLRKMEVGKLKLDLVQADIVLYLRYILESYEALAELKDIRLHFLPDEKELWMDFDKEKMLRIISNLLSNAIKFTPEQGDIYLLLEKSSIEQAGQSLDAVQIQVKDTGIGIPEEEQAHIFDRFYSPPLPPRRGGESPPRFPRRGEEPTVSLPEQPSSASSLPLGGVGGAGIGLALTKDLATLMGGWIQVSSEPGKGTTFTIRLPISRQAPEADINEEEAGVMETLSVERAGMESAIQAMPALANDGRGEKPSLLIVEDSPDVMEYLTSLLDEKYVLYFARDGQEGIDMALEKIPDLIVSDVMMPRKDGFELCDTLKQDYRTSHIPIVLLTAKTSVESRIKGLEHGADAYLAKPFNQKELFVRLEKLIELRRQLQKRYQNVSAPLSAKGRAFRREDAFIAKLQKAVKANISDPRFGTAELCREIGMSRSQLHLKIKALTNRTTSHFIRSIRLHKARELLQQEDLNVSQVAFEVGFNDLSYFSRKFTEEFGVNPKDVRNN